MGAQTSKQGTANFSPQSRRKFPARIFDRAPQATNMGAQTSKALYIGIEEAKPGNYVSNIGHAIETFIKPYGYGIVETFTGHGIGKELHEAPQVLNYGPKNQGPKLKPGMTICIEPMVNLGTKDVQVLKDGWTVVTKDKRLSAHFEHMVLITEDGCEIMTTLKE